MRVLCLSGGAAHGADQAGRIYALAESGIKWDAIIGVSVGAVNGCALSGAGHQAMKDLWWSLNSTRDVMRLSLRRFWNPSGLYHFGPLRKKIEAFYEDRSWRNGVPIYSVFCDLQDGSLQMRSSVSAESLDAHIDNVLSSCSVALINEPIKDRYVDGGHRDVSPLAMAIDLLGATEVDCIVTQPVNGELGKWSPSYPMILSSGMRALELMVHEIVQNDLKQDRPKCKINVHSPKKSLDFSPTDYSRDKIRAAFDRAYKETLGAL